MYYIIGLIIILFIIDAILNKYKNTHSDSKNSKKYMSRTEYRIAEYLDKLGVTYKMQYTFSGCRDRQKLSFDFAILNEHGSVVLLIEYDGEQHYNPVAFKGESKREAEKNFKKCQKHDNIKNRFCKKRHIPLLRIPYWENKNLYKIIKRTLYEQNILK